MLVACLDEQRASFGPRFGTRIVIVEVFNEAAKDL